MKQLEAVISRLQDKTPLYGREFKELVYSLPAAHEIPQMTELTSPIADDDIISGGMRRKMLKIFKSRRFRCMLKLYRS